MEFLSNTDLGLTVAILLILQYSIITGYLVIGGYRKKLKIFTLNLIPGWWLWLLLKAVAEAFYETVILNRKK